MKVGYTEFSFGYAFTENLIRSCSAKLTGAPVFPNLVQEAQFGFDVKINLPGTPLFFQYKLPELMRRSTAFELANWHCPGLSVPFFRITMMRRDLSRQHELLIKLESKYPSSVFYAAPCIGDIHEFDKAYTSATVAQHSIFISPTDIGSLPDDKAHSIAYRAELAIGYFCSELKKIGVKTVGDLIASVAPHFATGRFSNLRNSARELRETVLELASPTMRQNVQEIAARTRARRTQIGVGTAGSPEVEQTITDILVAREVARVDMGVDVLIAQPA